MGLGWIPSGYTGAVRQRSIKEIELWIIGIVVAGCLEVEEWQAKLYEDDAWKFFRIEVHELRFISGLVFKSSALRAF